MSVEKFVRLEGFHNELEAGLVVPKTLQPSWVTVPPSAGGSGFL